MNNNIKLAQCCTMLLVILKIENVNNDKFKRQKVVFKMEKKFLLVC